MYSLINGVFCVDLEMAPGKYEYKFVINKGQYWVCEQSAPKISNGMGD